MSYEIMGTEPVETPVVHNSNTENTELLVANTESLMLKNDIIGYLGDDTDFAYASKILTSSKLGNEDLKNLNSYLRALPDAEREKKTRDILHVFRSGALVSFKGGASQFIKGLNSNSLKNGAPQFDKGGASQLNISGTNTEDSEKYIFQCKSDVIRKGFESKNGAPQIDKGGASQLNISGINTEDSEKYIFQCKSDVIRKGFESKNSNSNNIKENLCGFVAQSIENGENPFVSKGDNPYYAVKIPENFQLSSGNSKINANDNIFLTENLDKEDFSKLKSFAIAKSEERLYKLIEESEDPHELIKDKDFFEQFKQYVYLDTSNISDKLKENEVKCIEDCYKAFLHTKLFLKVEGLDADIESEWERREEEINREYIRILEEIQEKTEQPERGSGGLEPDNYAEKPDVLSGNNFFNTATGVEIAEKLKLGNKLGNYSVNLDSYNANYSDLQEIAFNNERQDLIVSHDELNGIITKDDMINYNIFDKEHNALNLLARENFCDMKNLESEKRKLLWEILNQFFWGYKNAFNTLLNNPSTQKESVNNYIKNYAIGSVIDNIKGIFTEMAKNFEGDLSNKGFVFTDNEPVKIDGDNLIIKGSFNGTDIVIRYNLSTGEVFMNSFIQYNATDNKFKIGENSSAYQKIGDFENFSDFLSNRYESKFQNLNDVKNISNNIQLIGEEIINTSKRQSAKNTAVMKLLKTYNILGYPGGLENIDFNSDSKFFKFFQIVDETARNNRVDALDYFNNKFMPIIMEYNGLTWGENNLEQNKTNPKSSIFFDESSDNQTLVELRKLIGNFNPNAFKGIGNFDATQNLGILDFILGNLLNTTGTEIDISKMDDFIRRLESGGKKL